MASWGEINHDESAVVTADCAPRRLAPRDLSKTEIRMSRATKALAALAALAASASAAYPPAAANCSRHIRVGVFDDANPLAASFLIGRSQTPDAATSARVRAALSRGKTRSGANWMHGQSFKRLSQTRADALSPSASPASTGSHVDPRSHHRGAFFRTSVASLDA